VAATFLVIYLSFKWCALRKEQLYRREVPDDVPAFRKVAERRSGAFQFSLSTDPKSYIG